MRARRLIPWTRQPPYPVGIDWSNPLASGLTFLWTPVTLMDAAGSRSGTSLGSAPPIVAGSAGLAAAFNGSESIVFPRDARLETPEVTLFALASASQSSAPNYEQIAGKVYKNNAVNPYTSYSIYQNGSDVLFTVGTGGFMSATWAPGAGVFSQPLSLALTYDGTTIHAYAGGVGRTTGSGGGAIAYDPSVTGDFIIGGDSATAVHDGFSGSVYHVAAWNRVLSSTEIRAVSANPWQLFAPQRAPRFYLLPAGGSVYAVSLSESGSAADSLSAQLSAIAAPISEPSSAADSLAAPTTRTASVVELSSGMEAVSSAASYAVSVQESAPAADSLQGTATYSATLYSSGSASDAAQPAATFTVAVDETATAADAPGTGKIFGLAVSEPGSAVDLTTAVVSYTAAYSESGSAADALSALGAYLAHSSEAGAASDAASSTSQFYASVQENAAAADLLGADAVYVVTIAEASAASDAPANYTGAPVEAAATTLYIVQQGDTLYILQQQDYLEILQ